MKIHKIVWLIILLTNSFGNLYSQDLDSLENLSFEKSNEKLKKNSVRLEIFGRGPFYGIYYDRKFIHNTYDIRLSLGTSNFIPNKIESVYNINIHYCYTKYLWKPFIGIGFSLFYNSYPIPKTKFERIQLLNGTPVDVYPYLRQPFKPAFFIPLGVEFNFEKRNSFQIVLNYYAIKQDYYKNFVFGIIPGINYGFNF